MLTSSFKYRLYPTKSQCEALRSSFWFCKELYNAALQERKTHYNKYGKGASYNSQASQLADIKKIFKEETDFIYSQSLQQVLKQIDAAYKNFFRRVKNGETPGYPRYKSIDRFNSICFPQVDSKLEAFGGIKLISSSKIQVYGIENPIKIVLHRPFEGRCKQARIKKDGDQYYLVLTCEIEQPEPLAKTNKEVGIDLGLNNFITTDDGTKFHHPKPYKTSKEKLIYLQSKRDKKVKGSNNKKKLSKQIRKLNKKIVDIREDWQHKTANTFIKDNDKIYVEKLEVQKMIQSGNKQVKNSNISDAAWSSFTQKLIYKAERAGREVIFVNPKNTSKMCFCCGNLKSDLQLSDREYYCWVCGELEDRDINAAKNVKRLGINLAIEPHKAA